MEDLHPSDPQIIGVYRIRGRIATGGMGVVYLAEDRAGRQVALKLLRPELADDPGFRARFRREVEAGQRVGGICTARYVDADLESDHPYLATQYVAEGNLYEYVTTHGPLVGEQLVGLAVGLAEALVAMNAVGVIHRDLKPSNVLMSPTGPKVVDFGIAHAVDGTVLTQTGNILGSPGWMAPEQALGHGTTEAIDVFSWGATVAFAATGRSPFGEGRADAILYRIVHEDPDLSGLDRGLWNPVVSALQKDPSQRPSPDRLLVELVRTAMAGGLPAGGSIAMATAVLDRTWHGATPQPEPEDRSHRLGWTAAVLFVVLAGMIVGGVALIVHLDDKKVATSPPSIVKNKGGESSVTSTTAAPTPTTNATASPPSSTVGSTVVPSTDATPPPGASAFDFNAASQTVNQLGYNVVSPPTDQEPARGALNVLIGQCDGSATGYCENAFFFVGGKYIGTDVSGTDIQVSVAWQTHTTAALRYPLYGQGDPHCCPTGGARLVRFRWNGHSLRPLDPLPADPNQE